MKRLKISLTMVAFAAGIAGAIASRPAPVSADTKLANPYWFDSAGNNLGQRSQASQQQLCGTPMIHCANGYASIDAQGNPVGAPVGETKKPQ